MKIFTVIFLTSCLSVVLVECQRDPIPRSGEGNLFDSRNDRGRSSLLDYPRSRSSGSRGRGDRTNRRPDDSTPNGQTSNQNTGLLINDINFHQSLSSDESTNRLNVRNSGQRDYWRQAESPGSEQPPTADESTTFRRRPGSQRSGFPQNRRPVPRNSARRRQPFASTPLSRRNRRPYQRRRTQDSSNQIPPTSKGPGIEKLTQQLVEPSLFEGYKQFYKNTVESCGNGTSYVCRFDPTNKAIGYLRCISLLKRCDGIPHCPLADDEEGCPLPKCKPLQVRCHDGACATVCDGIPECKKLEDEVFCAPVCNDGHLRCPDGNCASVCDGKKDCKNGEDEMNCKEIGSSTKVCGNGEVTCSDRKTCAKVCDGVTQCADGADEQFVCT